MTVAHGRQPLVRIGGTHPSQQLIAAVRARVVALLPEPAAQLRARAEGGCVGRGCVGAVPLRIGARRNSDNERNEPDRWFLAHAGHHTIRAT